MTIIESNLFQAAGAEPPTLQDALRRLDHAAANSHDGAASRDALGAVIEAIYYNHNHLLEEIRLDQPRLAAQIEQLYVDLDDIRTSASRALDEWRTPSTAIQRRSVLAHLARRIRQHLSQEADIVFDAIGTDLGVGD